MSSVAKIRQSRKLDSMKTIFVSIVLATWVGLSQQYQNSYANSIKPLTPSTVPVNPIAKQCGGAAKLLQQRNSLCVNPQCKGPVPKTVTIETDLTPSKDIAQLGWRVTLVKNGAAPAQDHESLLANGAVKAGQSYTFQSIATTEPDFKGTLGVKYEFFDAADKAVDLCIEANFEFV